MENYVVLNSPFVRSKNDVNKMFLFVSVALVIPAIFGVLFFGYRAFFVILVSVLTCLISEIACNFLLYKKFVIPDFSFFVTAMILALTMPYSVPMWIVVLSGIFAIVVVKIAFGGLGRNKFNPANTARCFAGLISSGLANSLYVVTVNGEELFSIAEGGTNTIINILIGESVGGIGTTCVIAILVCLVLLIYFGVVDFKIPLVAIVSYFAVSLLFGGLDQSLINICSGSFLFACVFMLPEPNTSPDSLLGKILYAFLFGALSCVLWNVGGLGENTIFAVLLFVNLLAPFMDQYFVVRPILLGGYRNAR